jgi:hypothetical protein
MSSPSILATDPQLPGDINGQSIPSTGSTPNQACRAEMRRISTSAPIRISIFLPRISPLEMRRVSSTKARATRVDDGALKLYSV